MYKKFNYRLGLDIGTTSIGWAILRLDSDMCPCQIIKTGVRIFSDGRNPKDGSSLAVTRRSARQARRRRDRQLGRKNKLLNALVEEGFFPSNEAERRELTKLNPYILRRKGLVEALSPAEFARVLFHLNQRRGFKSNRKADAADNESGLLKSSIVSLRKILDEGNFPTLGAWLADRHEQRLSVRARRHGEGAKAHYDFYADRAMVEHEIDVLWTKQQEFNQTDYTLERLAKFKDILLFQRRLRPVKVGRCSLLPDYERAALALPSVQRMRIYQELNNLRLVNTDLSEGRSLSVEERDLIAHQLEYKKSMTFGQIKKVLKLASSVEFNLESDKRKDLRGNITSTTLSGKDYFGELWESFDASYQDKIVMTLLSEESESELALWLTKEFNLAQDNKNNIVNVKLVDGYGNLSQEAIQKVLPALQDEVVTYDKAVKKAGLDSHSALSYFEQTGELMSALPYYGEILHRHVAFGSGVKGDSDEIRFGKIANPTVHIGLNQLRLVVNALIKKYGQPAQIVVELARDLKNSKKMRDNIARQQAIQQKINLGYRNEIAEILGCLPENVKSDDLLRMRLWTELNPSNVCDRCCTFTGTQISKEILFGPQIEIEHLLPFSRTLDDSLNNKTLVFRDANRFKANRTPDEAFNNDEAKRHGYDYEKILQRAAFLPPVKRKKFAVGAYANWLKNDSDFLARALNDTRYLSRLAREYLTVVCGAKNVTVIPGQMSAKIRAALGLNKILSSTFEKTRNDHRHHAVDAIVVALSDRGLLQRFARANQASQEKRLSRLFETMTDPWEGFYRDAKQSIMDIKVSHKPDHGYEGQLHEETAHPPKSNRGVIEVRENLHHVQVEFLRQPLDENGLPEPFKKYVGGNNYCIEITENGKGKWEGKVISRFQAYQIVKEFDQRDGKGGGIRRLRHPSLSISGKKLVMRLVIDDVLRMKIGGNFGLFRVVKMNATGQIFFAPIHEANVNKRDSDKSDEFKYVSKTPGSMQTALAQFCSISPIGLVRRF